MAEKSSQGTRVSGKSTIFRHYAPPRRKKGHALKIAYCAARNHPRGGCCSKRLPGTYFGLKVALRKNEQLNVRTQIDEDTIYKTTQYTCTCRHINIGIYAAVVMTYYIRSMCLPNVALAWNERFIIFVFSISFFASHFLPSPFFSLPPRRNPDPGSRSRFFSPSTHYGSCFAFFFARRFQLSPRRLASNVKNKHRRRHIYKRKLY